MISSTQIKTEYSVVFVPFIIYIDLSSETPENNSCENINEILPATVTGTGASTIGAINPIRYRSYYYDTETGFYYLQTRYYNPTWGRFINADGQLNGGLLGYNMFAYCGNNPIIQVDSYGRKAFLQSSLYGANSLPKNGDPGSSQTLYNPDGTPKQKRWYGPDGLPERDRDYNHPGNDIPFRMITSGKMAKGEEIISLLLRIINFFQTR